MQKENIVKLKQFKNAYCDVVASGLGAFFNVTEENYKDVVALLSKEEIDKLCHYVVLKNVLAGVGEVNLKVPYIKSGIKYLDKYELNGNEILEAGYVNNLTSNDVVGGRFILEITNLNEYNGAFLSDISHFCAVTDTPVLVHFGRKLEDVGQTVNKFGMSPAQVLEDYGILDRECLLYGMNYIDKDDQLLLANYSPTLILSPRSDGEEGKGEINLYNLIYNRLKFCFSSGKCYNIDMLKEGKLSLLNTNNLMNKSGLVAVESVLDALQTDGEEVEIEFDEYKKLDAILEEGRARQNESLVQQYRALENEIKQIVKRLKGEN
ncbi:MAG: hypothetical protein IJY90_03765 [Clostridia bacterium]|nr:hypothetical protein [Clostridia bacterium]